MFKYLDTNSMFEEQEHSEKKRHCSHEPKARGSSNIKRSVMRSNPNLQEQQQDHLQEGTKKQRIKTIDIWRKS